jgi:O-antigen/teichoic acid export membrane protein
MHVRRRRGAAVLPAGSLELATRLQRLSREGLWLLAGQLASFSGALALVRLLTVHLNPAAYGHLALGLTLAGLVNQVIVGGLTQGIGRFYVIAAERRDLRGYLRASMVLLALASLAVCTLAALVSLGLHISDHSRWIPLGLVVFCYALLTGWGGAMATLQNSARQRALVALHTGVEPWLRVLLIAGLLAVLGPSPVAVAWGYLLAALLVCASQLRLLLGWWRRERPVPGGLPAPASAWTREIWDYSRPFSTWGLFSWAQQSSDRWSLDHFAASADVAQYVVLYQLGYAPLGMVTGLVSSLLGPVLFQRVGAADDPGRNRQAHRLTWRLTWLGLLGSTILFVLACLLHRPLFQLLVAPAFRPVSIYFPWLVLAGCLFTVGQILALQLMAEKRNQELRLVKISTCIAAIGLNVLAAKLFGMPGVVGSVILFSLAYLVWMVLLCRSVNTVDANLPAPAETSLC